MRVSGLLQCLRALGITADLRSAPHPRSFLPHVWIEAGILHATPRAAAGAVMHEAGHLAVTPSRFRPLIEPGSISEEESRLGRAYASYIREEAPACDPDHWLTRAVLQAGEQEAISWSYAAALHIGLPPERVFLYRSRNTPRQLQPYGGEGREILEQHRLGMACGIHGLHHAGMLDRRKWPQMTLWLQR